jgi:hypothetical protein
MPCRFNRITWLAVGILVAQLLCGCLSLRIEKTQEGVDVLPPPAEFIPQKTSLQEVLSRYGAPADLVDMNGDFALHYRRALYRGMKFSVGIPLKTTFLPNPSVEADGDLLRYDTAIFIFSNDGVLKDMKYEKGTERSLWGDFW